MRIFVDTSAFYALADESDRNHSRAIRTYKGLIGKGELWTTDYILIECWFLIARHLGREAALRFLDGLLSGIVELVKVERRDLEGARRIMGEYPDQDFSLVDATSFAVMERLGIERAFTFDDHFRVYRPGKGGFFQVIP